MKKKGAGVPRTLEECAELFQELAGRPDAACASEWSELDALVEQLEEPTSVMLLADIRVEIARRADADGRSADALAACNRALAAWPEAGEALLLRGSLHRALGKMERAEDDWRAALGCARDAVADYADDAEEEEGEDFREDPVCRAQVCAGLAAQYELALLLSQLGRHDEADAHLRQIGMGFKLAPGLTQWAAGEPRLRDDASAGGSASEETSTGAGHKRPLETADICGSEPVAVLDGVLPPSLVERLLDVFKPDAPFWREHGYPTDHFFSYLRQLPASHDAGDTTSSEAGTTSLLDELIGVLRPLVESHARTLVAGRPGGSTGRAKARAGQAASGSVRFGWAEWWCHSRTREGGHQLHFDLDEASIGGKRGALPRSPIISSVLYLLPPPCAAAEAAASLAADTADAVVGGPTVVFEQRLGDGALGERAWIVPPARVHGGRLCMFDGSLLHGVLPGKPASSGASASSDVANVIGPERRLTLMIGWWSANDKPPRTARSNAPPFAPCMHEPAAGSADATWPSQLLAAGTAVGARMERVPTPAALRTVSPAWVPVGGGCGAPHLIKEPSASCAASEGSGQAPAHALAGGPPLPQDALDEVSFFGRWFIPSADSIDNDILQPSDR